MEKFADILKPNNINIDEGKTMKGVPTPVDLHMLLMSDSDTDNDKILDIGFSNSWDVKDKVTNHIKVVNPTCITNSVTTPSCVTSVWNTSKAKLNTAILPVQNNLLFNVNRIDVMPTGIMGWNEVSFDL